MEEVKSNWQEVVEGSNSAVNEQNPCDIYHHNEEKVWPTSSSSFFDINGEIEGLGPEINNSDIDEFLDSVIINSLELENATRKLPPLEDSHASTVSFGGVNEIVKIPEEVDGEATGFLESLDKAVDKLNTHNAYCTNCNSHITKVVLQRVKKERRTLVTGTRRTLQKQSSVKMLHDTGISIGARTQTLNKIGLHRQMSTKGYAPRRIRLQRKLTVGDYGGGSDDKRYQEPLGQRKNFSLLATVALLSCLVFALHLPVLYGFISRQSDDRYYNLKVVALGSFLCVIILALAKAYTRGECRFRKYMKTVLLYVIIASMASGVAYAAGHFWK